ncbi:MAG: GDP-mannose 4,6-dehydratase [Gemmatimonadota bacterium]|nr:GDP-mannose 4,6-dehydratase [Gemmatimonadota bacterium]
MKVLVTGAAGFIGSHVTDRLLARGDHVHGLDSFDDFYPGEVKRNQLDGAMSRASFSLTEGDIRDIEILERLPEDLDAIVHFAARVGVRPSIANPALYSDVNVTGTARLLEFARQRNIRTFVFASSSSIYGNNRKVPFSESDRVDHPISPYAATKKAGELLCHAATHLDGISTVCLRFFTVYGPRQRPDLAMHKFAGLLRDGTPIPLFGDGTSRRDYTFIDDACDGVLAALDWASQEGARHEVINLGGGEPIALQDMIDVLADEMNVEPRIRHLPPQPGDVERTFADIEKAERLLGYRPQVDFRVGIRRFLEWFHGRPI